MGFLLFIIALALYLLPSIVAMRRWHPQAMAIFIVNAFLGWTFLGWVIALAWAFTAVRKRIGS